MTQQDAALVDKSAASALQFTDRWATECSQDVGFRNRRGPPSLWHTVGWCRQVCFAPVIDRNAAGISAPEQP